MTFDRSTKTLLMTIAVLLGILVVRPITQPVPAYAQADQGYPFWIEPGVTMLRKPDGTMQAYGKVMVDMRNGDVWGFPTVTQSVYPLDPTQTKPLNSSPIYLGRFMLNEANRGTPGGGSGVGHR